MKHSWQKCLNKITPMLTPPGSGVFTVNTAKERKEELYQLKYLTTQNVESLWRDQLQEIAQQKKPILLGVSSDAGGGILRGANWGPLFLRLELLREPHSIQTYDLGDIRVIPHLLHDKYLNSETISSCKKALYQDSQSPLPVSPLSMTETVLENIYETLESPRIFAIGGDHSVSYPLTKTYLKNKTKKGINTAIIHFDAHTDLLKERLGIDLCFGSWSAHILEDLPRPDHLVQIGIRSTGKPKSYWEEEFGVKQYWSKEVKDNGTTNISKSIIDHLTQRGVQEVYITFDIDAIDSKYAGATGTPEPDGLSPDQAITILREISSRFPITGADMVEIAPFTCPEKYINPEPDSTLAVAAAISDFLINQLNKE